MAVHRNTSVRDVFEVLTDRPIQEQIDNISVQIDTYAADRLFGFSTVTDGVTSGNCYVVSPFAMLARYSREELHKLGNPILRQIATMMIVLFESILRLARIDRIQILDNFLFSTNFFPNGDDPARMRSLAALARQKYPEHVTAVRSLNYVQTPKLIAALQSDGWIRLATRQVYLFKSFDATRRDIKRDMDLLDDPTYRFVVANPDSIQDFERARALYNELYLEKYTRENMHYSAQYMRDLCKRGLLHLAMLQEVATGERVAVIGIIGDGSVLTAPIVGYDRTVSQASGLYRRCIMYAILYAKREGTLLNLSSGAPEFKRNRGGEPEIEYMLIDISGVGLLRRAVWRSLAFISRQFYEPILRAYRL